MPFAENHALPLLAASASASAPALEREPTLAGSPRLRRASLPASFASPAHHGRVTLDSEHAMTPTSPGSSAPKALSDASQEEPIDTADDLSDQGSEHDVAETRPSSPVRESTPARHAERTARDQEVPPTQEESEAKSTPKAHEAANMEETRKTPDTQKIQEAARSQLDIQEPEIVLDPLRFPEHHDEASESVQRPPKAVTDAVMESVAPLTAVVPQLLGAELNSGKVEGGFGSQPQREPGSAEPRSSVNVVLPDSESPPSESQLSIRPTDASQAAPTSSFAGRLFGNTYEDETVKGWCANIANAFIHELGATGSATSFREGIASATEAILTKAGVTPEARGIAVSVLFGVAVAGNLAAGWHKHRRGSATATTYAGHALQIGALVTTVMCAGLTGRHQGTNGASGLLSTLLPATLKSYAYLSRDVINLLWPLKGSHDGEPKPDLRAQLLDTAPYAANQEGVNVLQDAAGLSGAGFADGLIDHSLELRKSIGDLSGYVLANSAGEGAAEIGARLAGEIAKHGFSANALKGMKTLRLSLGKMDTSKQGGWSQYADKAAGAQIARLSLFLSLYAASACLSHAMSETTLSKDKQTRIEEIVGALMIVAGCMPFAMSNVQRQEPGNALSLAEQGESPSMPSHSA
jgi:hypothetical protein